MSKRNTMLNRKIERLIKEDRENSKLIKNLDERNNALMQENISLLERDDFRQFRIKQLELLVASQDETINRQQEKIEKMLKMWKVQSRLCLGAYIVFIILMCIGIA